MPNDVDTFWQGIEDDIREAKESARPYIDTVHSVSGGAVRLKDGTAGSFATELIATMVGRTLSPGDRVWVTRQAGGKRFVLGKVSTGAAGDVLALQADLTSGLAGKSSSTHKHGFGSVGFVHATRDGSAVGVFNHATAATINSLSGTFAGISPGEYNLIWVWGGAWIAPLTDGNLVQLRVATTDGASGWVGTTRAAGSFLTAGFYQFSAPASNYVASVQCRNNVAENNPIQGGFLFALSVPYLMGGPT